MVAALNLAYKNIVWTPKSRANPDAAPEGTCVCLKRYLPEQHRQQQEDEDSHEETDGDDPSHHVTPGLLTVKGLKHQLQDNTKRVNQTGHDIQHRLTKHITERPFSAGPEIRLYRLHESPAHFLNVIMSTAY